MSALGNKEIFSKNLKYYMNKNNIDRNMLCTALKLPYSTITDWINGNSYPNIGRIEMLANYFGIEKSDLIEDKEKTEDEIKARAIARDFIKLDNKDKDLVRSIIDTMIEKQGNEHENS